MMSGGAWNLAPGRRVVFWRHGRTQWNVDNRFQGATDVALDDVGREQARAGAPALAAMKPSLIVSSDLSRAMETAAALADICRLPVRSDPRLRETDGGAWQGLVRPEIVAMDEGLFLRWIAGHDVRPPGGETRGEVVARVLDAVGEHLADVPQGGTMVVVSHGGSIRGAIGGLLGLAPEQWTALGVISNAGWSVLGEMTLPSAEPDGPLLKRWRLIEYNAIAAPTEAIGADDA
jgi:probable phosphoglycerate mutase